MLGGIRLEWICVGYVQCAGYVWDMCGGYVWNGLQPFEWIRIAWIRTGGIRMGGICLEWICVGFVPVIWWCCSDVFVLVWWCSCGVVLAAVFVWWCLCDKPQEEYAKLVTICTEKASKTSISCEASATFHRKSFQNDRFVRGFLQISQNKLPKRAFRAMLPTIFTEKASKMIVSCEASSKFHRTSFQNERFARCFRQFSQKKLPKWSFRARLPPNFTEQASKTSVSRNASDNFHRTSFQNERFARCFRKFSRKICVSLQFRAIDTPLPARGFIRQKQNVPRTTTPCIPKCDNVRFATAPCTKMYESIHREPTRFARTKMWGFTTVLGDRHHVFTERVARRQSKFAFRYSFGRSTPRFYREGSPRANEICVSLQFWAIDATFLPRGFTRRKWNLRFATVLGDRHHVFTERVHREQMKFAFRYSFGRSTTRF